MCHCTKPNRRTFVSRSAVAMVVAAGLISGRRTASAGTGSSMPGPAEALSRLRDGNVRYLTSPELCTTTNAKQRKALTTGRPWATILSCADSRVDPELIFGGLEEGQLLVCRNAGNLADTATMGTIEFGAQYLGTSLVVVLGHEQCGAIEKACEVAEAGTDLPGSIGLMLNPILPAAAAMRGRGGDFTTNVARESARRTAVRISSESVIIRDRVREGTVRVVYAMYSMDTGAVEFLD